METDDTTVVDADVVEEAAPGVALETRESDAGGLAVRPAVEATELVARMDTIKQAMQTAMTKDVDYGAIPGTGSKPTLLKPGAEKLGVLFQLDIQLENDEREGPGDHYTVKSTATVYHAPTGARLGSGEGLCSTREKKYAKRKQERVCPNCNEAAVIKGKQEFGGGWLCFKKKGGCGSKWPDGAEEIERQAVGEIDNPDLPDTWNTVLKMAEKRARVDAVLAVTGASALFTQDVEEGQPPPDDAKQAPSGPPWGPEADEKMADRGRRALAYLLDTGDGPDQDSAAEVVAELVEGNGYFPAATAGALFVAASKLKALLDARNAAAATDLGDDPDSRIPFGAEAEADETRDPAEEPNPDA